MKMVSILNSLPSSLRSDALTTELLKAVRRTGSKFDNNYTSHRRTLVLYLMSLVRLCLAGTQMLRA